MRLAEQAASNLRISNFEFEDSIRYTVLDAFFHMVAANVKNSKFPRASYYGPASSYPECGRNFTFVPFDYLKK